MQRGMSTGMWCSVVLDVERGELTDTPRRISLYHTPGFSTIGR